MPSRPRVGSSHQRSARTFVPGTDFRCTSRIATWAQFKERGTPGHAHTLAVASRGETQPESRAWLIRSGSAGAAPEPRSPAAMVSGYLNTFRDRILRLSHCVDNYVPGILKWAEMYDLAGLIAPRPLFVESGQRDDIFPIEASRASFARVKKVYEIFGAADLTEQEIFDGPHSFHGLRGLPFLARHLGVSAA
jgi:hypothetical protein